MKFSYPRILFGIVLMAVVLGIGSRVQFPEARNGVATDEERLTGDPTAESKVATLIRDFFTYFAPEQLVAEVPVVEQEEPQEQPAPVLPVPTGVSGSEAEGPPPPSPPQPDDLNNTGPDPNRQLPPDNREKGPTEVYWDEVPPGTTRRLGGIDVRFWTEPAVVQAGEAAQLFWEITEAATGDPVTPEGIIHYTPMHEYVTRADLTGVLMHLHASQSEEGVRRENVTFPTGGRWHVQSSFAVGTTGYKVMSAVNVLGDKGAPFSPDFSRTKELSGKWNVTMNFSSGPVLPVPIGASGSEAEGRVFAGVPVTIWFDAVPIPGGSAQKLEGSTLDGGHNIIFVLQDELFIWNMHGDRSVEVIGPAVGFPHKRYPIEEHPMKYDITFTRAGLWLIHFEIGSGPIRFFVEVV